MLRIKAMVLALSLAPAAQGLTERPSVPVYSDGNGVTIRATPLDEGLARPSADRSFGVVYDSLASEGNVTMPTSGPGGWIVEDYVSTITSYSTLDSFSFAGGVATAGHIIFVDFFADDFTYIDGFGAALPDAGNFVYTFGGLGGLFEVPASGYVQIRGDDGTFNSDGQPTNLTWLSKDVAPAVGSTSGDVYLMQIGVIPSPGMLAACGLAGLGALRRRR
jgi:hypothetical protein